jgi:hypothetical protein
MAATSGTALAVEVVAIVADLMPTPSKWKPPMLWPGVVLSLQAGDTSSEH